MVNINLNLATIRDSLEEWASEEEQRKLWLSTGANGAEVSSFVEASECLFTDTGIGRDLRSGKIVFSTEIDAIFVSMDQLLDRIDSARAPEQIIDDVRMVEVRHLAKHLLDRLPNGSA